MAHSARAVCIAAAALTLAACSHPAHVAPQQHAAACTDRATNIIAANVAVISRHRYGKASHAAENAARISLGCGDRWRAANALIVAAELAHQAKDQRRAHGLLAEGYALMHAFHPSHATALTSTLMAERLDTARRDMHGQWAYW